MSSTGNQIRLAVGRELWDDNHEPLVKEVVTSSTSAVVDVTNLEGTRYTSQSFRGWAARGQSSGVRTYGDVLTVSSGSLAISPAATLTSSEIIELWSPHTVPPDAVDRARDRALTQLCTRWRMVPLTFLTDGDMLASGVTNWTGSSATPTKGTETNQEAFVESVLTVTNSGANGYAGQTLNAAPSEQWYVRALAQMTSGTGTAEITASGLNATVAITIAAGKRITWTGLQYQLLEGTFTIPSTSNQVSIRLGSSGASDVSNWANVIAQPTQARDFILPRVTNSSFVGLFYEVVGDWPEQTIVPLSPQPKLIDTGSDTVRVHLMDGAVGTRAIFWQEFANYAALQTIYTTAAGRQTGDAASTNCELEYVRDATLLLLFGQEQFYTGRGQVHSYQKYRDAFESSHRQFGAKKVVRFVRDTDAVASA